MANRTLSEAIENAEALTGTYAADGDKYYYSDMKMVLGAAKAWNTRTDDKELTALRELLDEATDIISKIYHDGFFDDQRADKLLYPEPEEKRRLLELTKRNEQ